MAEPTQASTAWRRTGPPPPTRPERQCRGSAMPGEPGDPAARGPPRDWAGRVLGWVQDAQINVVAPWSLSPGRKTEVCVSYNAVQTNCLNWPVVQTAPAVFTVDGIHAAALNQDGTLNSADNPAPLGSIVSVFATGLGPIAPPQANGTLVGVPLPTNVLTVGVEADFTIGIPFGVAVTTPFDVKYAGPAPSLVAGASQINFQVGEFPSYGAVYLNLASTYSPGFEVYIAGQ